MIAKNAVISGSVFSLVVAALGFPVIAVAQDAPRPRGFYPNVVVTTHDNLSLEFLNEAVTRPEECSAAADLIANTVRASCPACSVTRQHCPRALESGQRKLLSDEPIDIPSSRLPNGVVAYHSDDPSRALAACEQTERLTDSRR